MKMKTQTTEWEKKFQIINLLISYIYINTIIKRISVLKIGKDLSSHFSKEEIKMA